MLADLWRLGNEYAPAIHGSFSAIVLLLAVMSKRPALWIAAALLSADWFTWNLTQIVWGYPRSTMLLPTGQAMYCGFMVLTWSRTGRLPALALVSYFFVVAIIAWAAFIWNNAQTTFACLLTANAIFFAQEATIGAASAFWVVRNRMAGRAPGSALRLAERLGPHRLHDLDATSRPQRQ